MADTETGTTHRVTVPQTGAGVRLDRALAEALPEFSRTRLKTLVVDGRVQSGGATITEPSYRVKPGQSFTIDVPAPVAAVPRGEKIALDILYEDSHLLVLDKPAGLVVHPAPGNAEGTLVNALIAHCGDSLSGIGGVRRPGILHRLDKDTSGVMVAAKTDAAHAALSAQFAGRTIERAYDALVWGVPHPTSGEIAGNIGRSPRNRKKMAVLDKGGRAALTHYRVVRAFGTTACHLECRLGTGRTHQLRVHLAHLGHSIIGDPLYGGGRAGRRRDAGAPLRDAVAALGRQALHAKRLGFRHPASGETLQFETDLPVDIRVLLNCLETI
jgi:23S rRNA pseudouridine1911/1915/1917 synthase